MSQPPTPYTRVFDFTDFSAMQPSAQQPGQKIDQELNASLTSTNQTISRLNEIQRDDGKLRTSALDLTELTTIAVPPGGTTGQVLAKTSNVSYATAWTTLSLTQYVEKANNLSDLANAATARTNLGLGTMATQSASNYALLDSPALTGNPTSVTPASSDNDTSIATTAFVKAQSYLTTATAATTYLPLAGGAMDTNAEVTFSDGTKDSEIGGWGFGVELTADTTQYATVEPTAVTVTNGAYTATVSPESFGAIDISVGSGSYLTHQGVIFPDNTFQNTAYPGGIEGYRPLTDYDFTNVADTKLTGFGMTLTPLAGTIAQYDSYINSDLFRISYDDTNGESQAGDKYFANYGSTGISFKSQSWADNGEGLASTDGQGASIGGNGVSFINWDGSPASGTNRYLRSSIVFPNASVQTIAFPGFNNVALTGSPTAPTPALADNDTSIATTAFVQQELASGTANARNLEVYVRNQTGSTIPIGSIVYINGATGNRPTVTLAQANNDTNSAQTIGFTKTAIANNGFGFVIVRGELENLNTNSLTEGVQLYLSPTVAGAYTITKPSAPQHLVYVGIVIRAHPTLGVILVSVQNGYELAEIHDVALASEANNDLLTYESSTDLWKNKSFATLGLATLASPAFTGTPSLPTGTTGITQTAGNNTTALATTAFVTAAVPAFATIYQARDGTSTTLAVNPAGIRQSLMDSCYRLASFSQNAVSGTGATVSFFNLNTQRFVGPNASLAGYSLGRTNDNTNAYLNYSLARGLGANTVSFAKPYIFSFRLNATTLAGNTIRFKTGSSTTNTGGDLTVDGFGIRIVGTGAVELQCFKTSPGLTNITSSFTPTSGISFDVIISSNNGTVLLYINDTLVATNTDGPTSANAFNSNSQIEVIGSGTQASNTTALVSNFKIFNGP